MIFAIAHCFAAFDYFYLDSYTYEHLNQYDTVVFRELQLFQYSDKRRQS